MRILIIDDDEQIRHVLQEMMKSAGYEVMVAENGKIAMQMQREHSADLVITDLIMPEQEGLETIAKLKSEFDGIKIIAMSGGGRIGPEAYLPAALELGADRIFTKPFKIGAVLEAVKELLDV